ncbi:hypothetical protein RRF57_011328 [Xylaria bambusicola]|uniref:CMP/dCMP-type deaminase domain-containing protein n=1 Tax=Xylaria bambusicola TaxID=326684 RepID=A0AAN7ZD42_9PEZI
MNNKLGNNPVSSSSTVGRSTSLSLPRSGKKEFLAMDPQPIHPSYTVGDHEAFMGYAAKQAQKSPPAPNKFCVGAVLVDADKGKVLSTGYSLEYPRDYKGDPGTTHAEQCCFIKIADKYNLPEERIGEVLPSNTVLYTTMEPCNERLSGNMTCATRILRLNGAIKTVYVGIKEPGTFITHNDGQERLEAHGVKVVYPVEHMRDMLTKISMAGHADP